MHQTKSCVGVGGLALLAALSTQVCSRSQNTTVVPNLYANVEAGSYTAYPFGLASACRLQYLYDGSTITPVVMPITKIAFRGDGTVIGVAKTGVDLEIMVSGTSVTPWGASTTFASNHGPTPTLVFRRKLVNLPAQQSGSPPPFLATFPFDVPGLYIEPVAPNLLIDYIVHALPSGQYTHDTSFTQAAQHTANGTACGITQSASGGSATSIGAFLTYTVTGAAVGAQALHLLGAALLPAPLPLPLGGCSLWQDVLLASPMSLSSGRGTINYLLHYVHKGLVVHGQAVAVDAALMRIDASQSHATTIGGYDAHTRIYHLSSSVATTGTIQVGVGIVTELTY